MNVPRITEVSTKDKYKIEKKYWLKIDKATANQSLLYHCLHESLEYRPIDWVKTKRFNLVRRALVFFLWEGIELALF
jgi:hypothetical protein